jgi:hypothetical protein
MVMAIIYVKCGKYDEAIDQLEVLLSEQTGFTVNSFSKNSNLDPLRDLPRYQEMIRKYSSTAARP